RGPAQSQDRLRGRGRSGSGAHDVRVRGARVLEARAGGDAAEDVRVPVGALVQREPALARELSERAEDPGVAEGEHLALEELGREQHGPRQGDGGERGPRVADGTCWLSSDDGLGRRPARAGPRPHTGTPYSRSA